jgi:tRNA G18 (ribose-2'-O)-methylase SpoU
MFTEKKFKSLPQKTQAKKLADILKSLFHYHSEEWKQEIDTYNQLREWYGDTKQILSRKRLDSHKLMERYTYWLNLAGLNVEQDLYTSLTFKDNEEAQATTIKWDVLLHNLRSAHNIGSILRTMDCFGLNTAHLSGYSAPSDHKSVKGAAMGAEEWMHTVRWASPFAYLDQLPEGTPIIALETDPNAPQLENFEWPENGVVIVGNEELGIPEEILDRVTHRVQIAMYGRKASLNVANAFAICAFQLRAAWEKKNVIK